MADEPVMIDKGVRRVIKILAKPGQGKAILEAFQPRIAEMLNDPGFLEYDIFQSATDPDKLVLLELWADQAGMDFHNKERGNFIVPELRAGRWGGPGETYEYTGPWAPVFSGIEYQSTPASTRDRAKP